MHFSYCLISCYIVGLATAGLTKEVLESGLQTTWQTKRSDPVSHPAIWSQKLQRRGDRDDTTKRPMPLPNPIELVPVQKSASAGQDLPRSLPQGRSRSRSPPAARDTQLNLPSHRPFRSISPPTASVNIVGPGRILRKGPSYYKDDIDVTPGMRVKIHSTHETWPAAGGRAYPSTSLADDVPLQAAARGHKTTIGVTAGPGANGSIMFDIPGKEPEIIHIEGGREGHSITKTHQSNLGKVWGHGSVSRPGALSAKSKNDL